MLYRTIIADLESKLEKEKEASKEKDSIITRLSITNKEQKETIDTYYYEKQEFEAERQELEEELKNTEEELNKTLKRARKSKESSSSSIHSIDGIAIPYDGSLKSEHQEEHTFKTKDNKIIILENNQGTICLSKREKERERKDFIYWWNGMQLCWNKENNRSCFSVYLDNLHLSSVEVTAEFCPILKRGNNVYLSVQDSGAFCKFEFEEGKLNLVPLGKIEGIAFSLLEHGNAVYIGSSGCKLFKVQNKTAEVVLETKGKPTDIQIKGNKLRTVDDEGNCYVYCLGQNKLVKHISVGDADYSGNFLAEEYIVLIENKYLTVFDWKGKQIKKTKNTLAAELFLFAKIDDNTALSDYGKGIVIFNNSTLELKSYENDANVSMCYYKH